MDEVDSVCINVARKQAGKNRRGASLLFGARELARPDIASHFHGNPEQLTKRIVLLYFDERVSNQSGKLVAEQFVKLG